jgi:hypothetical protein
MIPALYAVVHGIRLKRRLNAPPASHEDTNAVDVEALELAEA